MAPGAGTPTFGPIKDIPAGGSPERWKRAAPQRATVRARPPAPILQQHSSRPHSCSHRGYDLGELSPGRDARSSHGGVGHTEGCPLEHPRSHSHHGGATTSVTGLLFHLQEMGAPDSPLGPQRTRPGQGPGPPRPQGEVGTGTGEPRCAGPARAAGEPYTAGNWHQMLPDLPHPPGSWKHLFVWAGSSICVREALAAAGLGSASLMSLG